MSAEDYFQDDSKVEHWNSIPMFPLPDFVMFPGLVQPLHIFEPRYRDMMDYAINADNLIAMALLKPGYETCYETKLPKVYQTVCVGRITFHEKLADGRYNLLLRGICRASIQREIEHDQEFRLVDLTTLEHQVPDAKLRENAPQIKSRVINAFRCLNPELANKESFQTLFDSQTCLGEMCDIVAYASQLSSQRLQKILECMSIEYRCTLLLEALGQELAKQGKSLPGYEYPPRFSAN